jgi:hypothetical protein
VNRRAWCRTTPFVLLLFAFAACGRGRMVRHGEVDPDALADVRTRLTVLRGLPFVRPVPAKALDQAALRAALAHEIDLSYAPGDLERLSAIYARLGLIAPGTDLRPALERLLQGQIAALYDPRTKTLALVSNAADEGGVAVRLVGALTGRDLVGELLVAHELTHALQDQHWGIPTTSEPLANGHADREIARRALLEGDATLAGLTVVAGRPLGAGMLEDVSAKMQSMSAELAVQYPDVPDVVRAGMAFQYADGTVFTARALTSGGWPAVDRVHAEPPESSEQVLHPERYFESRDHPIPIALGGTDVLERAGWTRVYEDTLGELDIRNLARRALPPPAAARAAAGWGGDRLRALARGDELVLVWMTAWDSENDAVEFVDAVQRATPDPWVQRRGDRVLVILVGPGGPDANGLGARVWAATRP